MEYLIVICNCRVFYYITFKLQLHHCACGKGSRGLMDRALDLKPEVTQGCGFKSWLWQDVSTTEVRLLSKAPNPQLLPGCCVSCPLLQVCALGWVKCREQISLLVILCIIVYVTNKAHLSLICLYNNYI